MNPDLELLLAQLELLRNRITISLNISPSANEAQIAEALKKVPPALLSPLDAEAIYFFTTVAKNNEAWNLSKILGVETNTIFNNAQQVNAVIHFLNVEIDKTKRYLYELEAQTAVELPTTIPANLPQLVRKLEEHRKLELEQHTKWRKIYESVIDSYNQRIIQGLSSTLSDNTLSKPELEFIAWKIVETVHESTNNQALPVEGVLTLVQQKLFNQADENPVYGKAAVLLTKLRQEPVVSRQLATVVRDTQTEATDGRVVFFDQTTQPNAFFITVPLPYSARKDRVNQILKDKHGLLPREYDALLNALAHKTIGINPGATLTQIPGLTSQESTLVEQLNSRQPDLSQQLAQELIPAKAVPVAPPATTTFYSVSRQINNEMGLWLQAPAVQSAYNEQLIESLKQKNNIIIVPFSTPVVFGAPKQPIINARELAKIIPGKEVGYQAVEQLIKEELNNFNKKTSAYANAQTITDSTDPGLYAFFVESADRLEKGLVSLGLDEQETKKLRNDYLRKIQRHTDNVFENFKRENPELVQSLSSSEAAHRFTVVQKSAETRASQGELAINVKRMLEVVDPGMREPLKQALIERYRNQLAFLQVETVQSTPIVPAAPPFPRPREWVTQAKFPKSRPDYITEPGWLIDEFPVLAGGEGATHANTPSRVGNFLLNNALGLGRGITQRAIGSALTRGAASTAARGAVGWAAANLVTVAIIIVLVLLIVIPLVQGMNFAGTHLPTEMKESGISSGSDYFALASGTCPLPEPYHILRDWGIYDPVKNIGHGSNFYWGSVGRGKYSYPIPDAYMYPKCNDPSCQYYGLAIDVVPDGRRISQVVAPYLCAKGEACGKQETEWIVDMFIQRGAQYGIILKDTNDPKHDWRVFLLHLERPRVQKGDRLSSAEGNNLIANLSGVPGRPHVHMEVTMDGIPVDPTPFCSGQAGRPVVPPGGGGSCSVPTNTENYCHPDNPGISPNIRNAFGSEADNAAITCRKESGGNPAALNNGCLVGRSAEYSVGLYQINILVHPDTSMGIAMMPKDLQQQLASVGAKNCVDGFNWAGGLSPKCSIKNQRVVDICRKFFSDPANNLAYARDLQKRVGWWPWSGAKACGIQ